MNSNNESDYERYIKKVRHGEISPTVPEKPKRLTISVKFVGLRNFHKPDRHGHRLIFVAGGLRDRGGFVKLVSFSNTTRNFEALTLIKPGDAIDLQNHVDKIAINEVRITEHTSFRIRDGEGIAFDAISTPLPLAIRRIGFSMIAQLYVSKLYARRERAAWEACCRCRSATPCKVGCSAGSTIECCVVAVLTDRAHSAELTVFLGAVELQVVLGVDKRELLRTLSDPSELGRLDERVDPVVAFSIFVSNHRGGEPPRLEFIERDLQIEQESRQPSVTWSDEDDSP
jgi:hypothetical protein